MSKKLDKLIKDAQSKYKPKNSIPFDSTDPRTILDPNCRNPGDRQFIVNMKDNAMRSIAYKVLEKEGMKDCSDKQLCKWLRENDIWTEAQLAAYCIDNLKLNEIVED